MSRKARWALAIAIALFIAATTWNVLSAVNRTQKTAASFDSVIGAVEGFCIAQEQRDRQIKVRGEAELALLELFLDLARKEPNPVSEEFVERFEPLTRKIHILPLPECMAIGDELRSQLPPG